MRNKKSQVEDLLPLLLVMVLMVFFLSCTAYSSKTEEDKLKAAIEFQSLSKDSTQLLINFLRNPIELRNGETGDISEAINIYFLTNDEVLLNQIKNRAKEYFSASDLETDVTFWSLEITYPGKKTIKIESGKAKGYVSKKAISAITMPTNDVNKNMEINLFIFYTTFI